MCKKPALQRGGLFCGFAARDPEARPVSPKDAEDPVRIPITDEIDLHTFRPAEIASLLEEYFGECQRRGFRQVRVIHGKGTGTLRNAVASLLQRSARVQGFGPADETRGGWGATLVTLKPGNSC